MARDIAREPCADCAGMLAERVSADDHAILRAERDRLYAVASGLAAMISAKQFMTAEDQATLRDANATLALLHKP